MEFFNASPRSSHDFSRIPVHPPAAAGAIPVELAINKPEDEYEQEADCIAERVMNIAGQPPAPTAPSLLRLPGGSPGGGSPLPEEVRTFMEPRFGFDFSQVRIHTDTDAMRMSRSLSAQAFTHREHIYFGAGKAPGTNALTAHELAHVLQQTVRPTAAPAAVGGLREYAAPVPGLQRLIEVRPPGRGEGSAFPRRQELIDRLSAQSPAISYRLDGRLIRYDIIDAAALTNFDRQMQRFIDLPELVPLRLTTGANRVRDAGGNFVPLLVDSFNEGYLDLDDLLADDNFSFQSDLVHLLAERFAARNYARRIGTNIPRAEFLRAHARGLDAEAALYRALFNDPSIQFNYEEPRPNGTLLFNFVSRDHHYQVFHVIRGTNREVSSGEMFVRRQDGSRVTMEDFRVERAAAPVAP